MKKQSTHCDPILDNTSVFKNILRIYKKTNGHIYEYEEKYEHNKFIIRNSKDYLKIWIEYKTQFIFISRIVSEKDNILIKFYYKGNDIKIDIREIDDIFIEDETILILKYGRAILNENDINSCYLSEYEFSQVIHHFDEFTRTIEGLKL